MSDELAALRARVERLESREACMSTFNEYLHYLDGGHVEDLLQVDVADDSSSAELSAYFITSGKFGFSGRLYQAEMGSADARWEFQKITICSTWGWTVPTE